MRLALVILVVALGQQNARTVTSAAPTEVSAPLRAAARSALPEGIPDKVVEQALRAGVWNATKNAVAILVSRPRSSLVFVFILQATGEFLPVDVSGVERANLGKLGSARAVYDRVETAPVRWVDRNDGSFQIVLRTRAWKSGRRFTVSEPLLIRHDGTVVWR